ncbi:hypothetical protein [Streptomyces sp. H39-S7]|uniref:hypothetical protein n=1 Tax=Streptomyces sp. H39-S7 TaxID=3004357 RepID=UPI0022AF411B|nr:hypothetical protein [Streptomyces sp. H39-S7]MCZ4120332.1 hypothetical protein [Streptomyces sp. H39-S7]
MPNCSTGSSITSNTQRAIRRADTVKLASVSGEIPPVVDTDRDISLPPRGKVLRGLRVTATAFLADCRARLAFDLLSDPGTP